jgi:hypothetical protein
VLLFEIIAPYLYFLVALSFLGEKKMPKSSKFPTLGAAALSMLHEMPLEPATRHRGAAA